MSRRSIPDLKHDTNEITLDHCYELVERLGEALDEIDGTPGANAALLDALHPDHIQESLQRYFNAKQFSRLFRTETGKGVLVGVFIKDILAKQAEDEDNY